VLEEPVPAPNIEVIKDFLARVLQTDIHLVAIVPDGGVEARWFGDDAPSAASWAAERNGAGKNLYWTVNCTTVGLHAKPCKRDIEAARFLHLDIDPPFDLNEVLEKLQTCGFPPSFIIHSGNGVQAFWQLAERSSDQGLIEDLNERLAREFNADRCHNIDRLMRLPGSVNYPNKKKKMEGRRPRLALPLMEDAASIWSVEDLQISVPSESPLRAAGASPTSEAVRLLTPDDLRLDQNSPLRMLIEQPPGPDRSADELRLVSIMRRAGFSQNEAAGVLMNDANAVGEHCRTQKDPARAIRRIIEKVYTDRPLIRIREGELHANATEAEAALLIANAPIYRRGEQLFIPVVDQLPAAKGRTTNVARLKQVDREMMRDYLSRSADWVKWDGRSQKDVPKDPPLPVCATILSRDGEWKLPALAGVITTPTLRPNGSILSAAGYDYETRLLLQNPPILPAIPEAPSERDAKKCLQLLLELISGFPFVDEASRAVALSMLITPIVRGSMPVSPMHVATAPVAGSGKSYLVDLASALATGERAPVLAAGRTEEETEKRLSSALLAAHPIVSIDNVNGELGGDMLCQMIERPLVSVRPLGSSKLVKIESHATVFATGNNIRLVEDMTRRAITCSLDPNMERPELRQFRSDPLDAVLADRGRYVAAALTIARAYIVAGCPRALPALASFEDWSRTVRSALVWLGQVDPVITMEVARTNDPSRSTLEAILVTWCHAFGAEGLLLSEVKARLENSFNDNLVDLRQALSDLSHGPSHGLVETLAIGKFLSKYQDRIVNGMKIVAQVDRHAKQKRWSVVRV
jgi:putative DNA primase/helicase